MANNSFVKMFKRYGWKVDHLGDDNYIAYNDMYFIPFSLNSDGTAAAVSYLICNKDDKDKFINYWRNRTSAERIVTPIGYFAFDMKYKYNKATEFFQYGGVYNHDHSCYEIESAILK